jgi:hypothetical protein
MGYPRDIPRVQVRRFAPCQLSYRSVLILQGLAMTRKEWQKKKKKMAGREGPRKGKVR